MASFYNIDKNDIQKKIIEYANIFDFVPNLNRKLTSLSSGQKKKVLIMQAFIHEPKLIIADEPTENLDPDTREIFYRLVKRAQKNGQTVFISTHNLDEIRNHIDYVVIIAKGRIRYSRAIHKGIDLHRIYNRFKPKVQI
jgi:ABC-2 type transport system ATP-binding protein